MNRRIFLLGLLTSSPALAALADSETFEARWRDRITGVVLRHVPAHEPFNERQFDDEVRKRTLTPPPAPKKPVRKRFAYRRRRRT